ncbi:MAG: hypothetical protein HC853_08805 [Anaerolineae bacterium]|nr:hypothetical protein [Anaerolineae bacterium]
MQNFQHVPVLLMSGQNPSKVEAAMRKFDDQRLRLLNKDNDFESHEAVANAINTHARKYYNHTVTFEFKDNFLDWDVLAAKFMRSSGNASADNILLRQEVGLELKCLAQMAFCGWDESDSPYVEAKRISIEKVLGSSSNSVVMLMRPFSKFNEAQADVIFKVARINGKDSNDHTQFDQYKNIVGGYGLRERRYKRTVRFHGQVYAVPYYKFEDTQTYAEFYREVGNDDECLETVSALTKYLFRDALKHLLHRRPTGMGALTLSDYYAERIKWERRRDVITNELMHDIPPISIRDCIEGAEGDDLVIGRGANLRRLRNPLKPVLVLRDYERVNDKVDTAVRHGDLHAENVLVDTEYNHVACWYIDYESFGSEHFILVDHVEFEASVLFSLMKVSENYEFWMRFVDAMTSTDDLSKLDAGAVALGPDKQDRNEAAKALAAIQQIRSSAQEINGRASPRSYYHAMMYEALRVAGKSEVDLSRRWFALITAAQLFEKVEN